VGGYVETKLGGLIRQGDVLRKRENQSCDKNTIC